MGRELSRENNIQFHILRKPKYISLVKFQDISLLNFIRLEHPVRRISRTCVSVYVKENFYFNLPLAEKFYPSNIRILF